MLLDISGEMCLALSHPMWPPGNPPYPLPEESPTTGTVPKDVQAPKDARG